MSEPTDPTQELAARIVQETLRDLFEFEYPEGGFPPETNLRKALAWDSMDQVEFTLIVQEHDDFTGELDENTIFTEAKTVGDLIEELAGVLDENAEFGTPEGSAATEGSEP